MTRRVPIPPALELRSDVGDAARSASELVDEIATELNLLRESRLNPDAFYERRDMLVKRLRRLARRLARDPGTPPPTLGQRRLAMARSLNPKLAR